MARGTKTWGDLTAFLALSLDNLGVLVFLSSILMVTYDYPADIILTRMIPGTALGVLMGDLVYTLLALRLRQQTGRQDVTAMPLGLDTPSTIGLAYAVLGPAYAATGDALLTWRIGAATLFLIGVVKVVASFLGGWAQRVVPRAGLMGSIAGIGLLLLGFLPLLEIFNHLIVGMVALGIVFCVLIGRLDLPGRMPGVLLAVACGTALHFALGAGNLLADARMAAPCAGFALPAFSLDFFFILPASLKYLTIAIPFGVLTIIGGINNTESARLAGDAYKARHILLTEAFSTLLAALFGGVAQTTPYIGHPAYKKMGGTHWYTLMTGLFIGLGAFTGFIPLIVGLIPKAVLAPIFIFIGFEIVTQAYASVPRSHSPAITFAFLPVVANLVMVMLGQFLPPGSAIPEHLQTAHRSLTVLSNGFIVTAILWGGMLSCLIDQQTRRASLYAAVCALLSLFGLMHSVLPTGEVYLPWRLTTSHHYEIALAYIALAVIFLAGKKTRDTHTDR